MSKKKAPSSRNPAVELPTAYSTAQPWWPAEFAAPRFAAMQAVFMILLGLLLYFSMATNGMLGFKSLLAWVLGVTNPLDLGENPSSFDICILIWCFFLVLGNTLLHPSLGLVTLAFLRPWLDGYTFKTDNVYFLWGAILILALWGVRAILRNEPLRFPRLTLLASAYLLVALLLSPFAFNFGDAYKQLLNWTGYTAVFIVAAQNLGRQRIALMALAAVLFGMAGQALFAVLQYHYVLPFLRHLINQDPSVLQRYFGVDHVTPEMQHRFNKNRAFGTVLFPNALAAFLILGIPACLALALNQWALFRPFLQARRQLAVTADAAHRRSCAAAAVVLWFVATGIIFAALQFPASYHIGEGVPWYLDIYFLLLLSALIALLPSGVYCAVALRHGFPMANAGSLFIGLGASLVLMLWALWLSYSRGGMLALLAAGIAGLVITFAPAARLQALLRWTPRLLALLACSGLALLAAQSPSPAEALSPGFVSTGAYEAVIAQPRLNDVTREGQNVSFGDLTNPESFSLRLSYWRATLRMFLDNPVAGVGLGNFKWAYPVYQRPGDGNVQEAHNSYLQAFAETGLAGGLVLLAFWGALIAAALNRIVTEEDPARRRLLIGLLTGLLAFLAHAAIDINFAHPTLMFYAMLFAGILCAIGWNESSPEASPRWRFPAMLLMLAVAALAVGLSTRPYFQNLVLTRMQFLAADAAEPLMDRYTIASYVLVGAPTARREKQPPRPVAVRSLALLDIDLEKYVDVARVYEPTQDGSNKLVPAMDGSPITPMSQLLFVKPWLASQMLEEDLRGYLAELAREDARFPHDPQLALHLSNWYQTLVHFPERLWLQQNGDHYYGEMMRWSNEAIARNPHNADVYVNLARSESYLWKRDTSDLAPLERAVAHKRRACELAPTQGVFRYELADTMRDLASQLAARGEADAAAKLTAEEKEVRAKGWELLRWGLPPIPTEGLPPELGAPGSSN